MTYNKTIWISEKDRALLEAHTAITTNETV